MKPIIVLATRNEGKVKEFRQVLGAFDIDLRSLNDFGPIPEAVEDGDTFEENAYKKALFTARVLGLPAIADDSGLVVAALGGAPGVYSARYAGAKASDRDNIEKLLQAMAGQSDRRAAFHCVISLAVPTGPALTYEGKCEGTITAAPVGRDGFGYDPVFFSPELGKTFAESTIEEKNKISHRGRALSEFGAEFAKIAKWLAARLAEAKPPKPDHSQFEHNDWSRDKMV
jgi:XTP/dITP diphosphohydrolase